MIKDSAALTSTQTIAGCGQKKNIKVQRKVKQLQSLIEKSESGVGWNACFANILLALKSICGNFPTVFAFV